MSVSEDAEKKLTLELEISYAAHHRLQKLRETGLYGQYVEDVALELLYEKLRELERAEGGR